MSVQVYAGGKTVYDSRLPMDVSSGPLSIRISETLNKGGTATMILLPGHPRYDGFVPLKTEVTVYRNGRLRWRGRSLISEDDLYCRRTILCEGELCFFNDAIQRPYSFNCSAAKAFSAIVTAYNAAVEPWKRFVVGTITVDATVELDCNKAEKSYETLRKLIQTYGGYILFDTAEDGSRRINWYAELPYTCNQPIRFGRNLLDYSTESDVTGFVTRLIPYGAEDEDGNRLQLNINGKDYVENEDAIAQCGIIEDTAYYDDIESADLLAVRAKLDLLKAASMPRTLKLSALDLSHQDMTMESFSMGQRIPAESKPHGLSGEYDLVSLEEDLLDPSSGSVSLTRSADYYRSGTLTGSMSQAAKDDAEAARLEALAQALARRDQIKKAMEESEAKAQELADQAESNANDYADDAAQSAADTAVEESKDYTDALDKALNQTGIFNRLTNNGKAQGLFMDGEDVYINASYIKTGILIADLIRAGILQSQDGTTFYLDLEKGVLKMQATELSISGKSVEEIASEKAEAALSDYAQTVTEDLESLQNQIDGNITTWFMDGEPTASTLPASDWTTDEDKNVHLGDLYYDNLTGYCYRWQQSDGTYSWNLVKDTDVTKALSDAAQAQDTADSKRRVFTATPTVPYDKGDLWTQGSSGDLKVCQTSRSSGYYRASDWVLATKYIDQTKADEAADSAAAAALKDAKAYADSAADAAGDAALADAKAYAATIAQAKVDAQTQKKIFNILTNNGQTQGIYLKDGKIYINMEYLVSKYLEATLIALRGQFEVYNGTTLGGYLGFLQGTTGESATNGVGLMNAAGDCYVAVTDSGAIMKAGTVSMYVVKNKHAVVNGPLYVSGTVYQNKTPG